MLEKNFFTLTEKILTDNWQEIQSSLEPEIGEGEKNKYNYST